MNFACQHCGEELPDWPAEAVENDVIGEVVEHTFDPEDSHAVAQTDYYCGPDCFVAAHQHDDGLPDGLIEAAIAHGAHDDFIRFVTAFPGSVVAETLENAASMNALDGFTGFAGSFEGSLWEHGVEQCGNPDTENAARIREEFDRDRWPTWMQQQAEDGGRDV